MLYGQEVNPETYAICTSDMLIKDENPENIAYGSTLSADGFTGLRQANEISLLYLVLLIWWANKHYKLYEILLQGKMSIFPKKLRIII